MWPFSEKKKSEQEEVPLTKDQQIDILLRMLDGYKDALDGYEEVLSEHSLLKQIITSFLIHYRGSFYIDGSIWDVAQDTLQKFDVQEIQETNQIVITLKDWDAKD